MVFIHPLFLLARYRRNQQPGYPGSATVIFVPMITATYQRRTDVKFVLILCVHNFTPMTFCLLFYVGS